MESQVSATPGKIGELIKNMKFLSRFYRNQPQAYYFQMIQEYYSNLRDAQENGSFVVAHTIFFPVEIFDAMGLVPLHLEYSGSMMSLFGVEIGDLLASAAEMGLAPEICSAHRLVGGALKMGMLPKVDAVICSNLVCDNSIKSGELTMHFNQCPGFIFDYPFQSTQAAGKFVTEELKRAIDFLERASGRKMDWDKLSETLAETARQIELIRQINDLCKAKPSPFRPQDFLKFLVSDYMGAGKKTTTLYLDSLHRDLKQKVENHQGFANPERLRLMGLMLSPWHLQAEIDAILLEHGAAIVCNPNLCDWRDELSLDPRRPLEAIAAKLEASSPLRMFGPMDERAVKPLLNSAKDYAIDGAVNFNHLGCRQMGPMYKIYKDLLGEVGVPVLNIDCDLIDPTVTSADEVREKLEQFFELLEDR